MLYRCIHIFMIYFRVIRVPYATMSISLVNYRDTFFHQVGFNQYLWNPYLLFPSSDTTWAKKKSFHSLQTRWWRPWSSHTFNDRRLVCPNFQCQLCTTCPVHPNILYIPNNATRVAANLLKPAFHKNLRVFMKLEELNKIWLNILLHMSKKNT